MRDDPIVEELHQIREEFAARFQHDLHAICENFRAEQSASGRTVVTRPPRKPNAVAMPRKDPVTESANTAISQTVG
jgi:hypothetical protein